MKKGKYYLLKSSWFRIGVLLLAGMLLAGTGHATPIPSPPFTFEFYQLTGNNTENLYGQIKGTVWDATLANSTYGLSLTGTNVLFTFTNSAVTASNITEIYFDDNASLISSLILPVYNNLGGLTKFTGGSANPGNLPSGNTATPPFAATLNFLADVAPGPPKNGINAAADILGIAFTLQGGKTWDNVYTELNSGALRVGLHVRSIGVAGNSDSYISIPPNITPPEPAPPAPVPEPATMLLLGTGLVGVAGAVRRKMKLA